MRIRAITNKLYTAGISAIALCLVASNSAFAHVTVKPAEVVTAGYQTFVVSVPNEKDIPTSGVKILIPDSIASATPTQKSGWQIVKETEGSGEETRISSISWEGGEIADGTRDEFSFSAKVPEKTGELQWKAYQTYADGTVVSWDKESKDGHGHDSDDPNSGPFSVTKVVDQTAQTELTENADRAAADAKVASERALYVGVAALVLSIAAVFLATRRK